MPYEVRAAAIPRRLRALFPRLLDEAHLRADAQAVERAFGDGVAVEIDLPSLRRFDEPVVPAGYEFRDAAGALGGVRLDLSAQIALDVLDLPHRGAESVADRDQHMFLAYVLWKTLEQWQSRAGLGNSPRTLLQELAAITSTVLDGDEAKKLLDSIDVSTIVGLRDRALIALLVYTFARISAALHMNVEDYYPQGKRWWLRLHEKGGKQHEMPAHHFLEQYVDAYVTAAGIGADKASPLFRTLGGRGRKQLSEARMARQDARRMIVRRALQAGITTRLGCHTFRATGITVYLLNGGLLEYAQQMAAHESARTTKLYDRRNDQVTLDQVERIVL